MPIGMPDGFTSSGSRRRNMPWPALAVLLLLALAAHWPALGNQFLAYDDDRYVTDNAVVRRGLSLDGLRWAFSSTEAANWHPITWLSHMADVSLFGLRPWGHHLSNLILHMTNVGLLFLILLRLSGDARRSFFAAAFFAVHPQHVQSVAWISERKGLLSVLFLLLALGSYLGYLRRQTPLRYAATAFFLALSLMSKAMAVTFPVLLLCLDRWPLGRFPGPFSRGSPAGRERTRASLGPVMDKLPLFALAGISAVIAFFAQKLGGAVKPAAMYAFSLRLANASWSYFLYAARTIAPLNLAAAYPHPGADLSIWQAVLGLVFMALIGVLAGAFRRRSPYLITGWAWYFLAFLPVVGLIQIGEQGSADRYTYLPLIGLYIAVIWALPLERARPAVPVLAVLLAASALAAFFQARTWRDDVTLFSRAAQVTDGNWIAYFKLARAKERLGRLDEAVKAYRTGIGIMPTYVPAYNELGLIYYQDGKTAEAETVLREAIRRSPAFVDAHINLGIVLERQGKLDEAVSTHRRAIHYDPNSAAAHYNLGVAYSKTGSYDEALAAMATAAKLDPEDFDTIMSLGILSLKAGRNDEAENRLETAQRRRPDSAEVHYHLGLLYHRTGRNDKALAAFQEAIRLRPTYVDAHLNAGYLHGTVGNHAQAMEEYQILKMLDPGKADLLLRSLK